MPCCMCHVAGNSGTLYGLPEVDGRREGQEGEGNLTAPHSEAEGDDGVDSAFIFKARYISTALIIPSPPTSLYRLFLPPCPPPPPTPQRQASHTLSSRIASRVHRSKSTPPTLSFPPSSPNPALLTPVQVITVHAPWLPAESYPSLPLKAAHTSNHKAQGGCVTSP